MDHHFVSEMVGTAILIIFGCGVVANVALNNNKGKAGGFLMVNFGWGLGVTMAVYVAARSGAHINPAVTIGLAVKGSFPWSSVPTYIAGQLVGAFIGAVVVWVAYMGQFATTEDGPTKLGVFSTAPEIRNPVQNVLTEVIGTFVLVFAILTQGLDPSLAKSGLGALIVGLLVVAIGISLGGPTGYAINPARDLGPRIAHFLLPIPNKGDSDWGYSWIPVVGPIIGGILAALIYNLLF